MKTRRILNLISLATFIPVFLIYAIRSLMGIELSSPIEASPMLILVLIGSALIGITMLWRGELPIFLWETKGPIVRIIGFAVAGISLIGIFRIILVVLGMGDAISF